MNYSTMTFEELEKVHKFICELTGSLDLQTIIYGLELYYIFINEIPEKYKKTFDYVEYKYNFNEDDIAKITGITPEERSSKKLGFTYSLSGRKLGWDNTCDKGLLKYTLISLLPYPEYKAQLEISSHENPES